MGAGAADFRGRCCLAAGGYLHCKAAQGEPPPPLGLSGLKRSVENVSTLQGWSDVRAAGEIKKAQPEREGNLFFPTLVDLLPRFLGF